MNPFPARRRVHPTSCGETLLNLGTSSLLPVWPDRSPGGRDRLHASDVIRNLPAHDEWVVSPVVLRNVPSGLTTRGRSDGCAAKRTHPAALRLRPSKAP